MDYQTHFLSDGFIHEEGGIHRARLQRSEELACYGKTEFGSKQTQFDQPLAIDLGISHG